MNGRTRNLRIRRLGLERFEVRNMLTAVVGTPDLLDEPTVADDTVVSESDENQSPELLSFGVDHEANLEQLGLAALNFESATDLLPAQAIFSSSGEPLLSWRVAILPYLGAAEAELFAAFHHDEPWDSPHNLSLLDNMPDVYRSPGLEFDNPFMQQAVGEFKTVYQAAVGPDTMFDGRTVGLRIGQAQDGPDTALFVQTNLANAVEWTKPQDLAFDALNPRTGLDFNAPELSLIHI